MINKAYGNYMWVAEDRVEEYKAAGHELAASFSDKPAVEKPKATKKKKK